MASKANPKAAEQESESGMTVLSWLIARLGVANLLVGVGFLLGTFLPDAQYGDDKLVYSRAWTGWLLINMSAAALGLAYLCDAAARREAIAKLQSAKEAPR
jgi:Na+/H+ antiporter NhaA